MILALRSFVITRIPLILFLIIYFFLALATFKDFGLTMDEFFVYTRGQYFYNKVVGNDAHLQKGFVIKEQGNENLLYYNSTYPALLYALNDQGTYEGYHLLNMLFSMIIFILLYELLLKATNKPYMAILGPLFLFFTPRFLGHIPANPKDTPFAVLYFTSLFLIYFHQKMSPNMRILAIGISIGLTTSMRMLGFALVPIYVIFLFFIEFEKIKKIPISILFQLSIELLLVGILAFWTYMISLPYLAADPFNHTLELLKVNTLYPWSGTVFFMNQLFDNTSIPLHYLPIWILITTPLYILGLSLFSFAKSKNSQTNTLKILIIISITTQIVLYFMLQPVIYNGMRHYLFILPQLIILAVIGLHNIFIHKKWFTLKIIVIVAMTLNIITIGWFYIQFHPYEYTYFNELVGGVSGGSMRYELDYWGASDKAALEWLRNEHDVIVTKPKLFLCSKSFAQSYYMPNAIDLNTSPSQADYIICNDQRQFNKLKEYIPGTVIYEIKRGNVVYSTIFQVDQPIPQS